MGILSDRQIKASCLFGAIMPYADQEHRPGVVSYGITSYGYDCRVGPKFKVFKPFPCTVIDPKNFDTRMLEEIEVTAEAPDNFILIPPHSFVLAETVETFDIPRDTLCVVLGKSTYARCGLIVNCTPLEPEWRGTITIELSNTTPLPMKVYVNEGIAQILFFRSDEQIHAVIDALVDNWNKSEVLVSDLSMNTEETMEAGRKLAGVFKTDLVEAGSKSCGTSYKDKKGKYMGQSGVQVPIVQGALPEKAQNKVHVKKGSRVRAYQDIRTADGLTIKKGEFVGWCVGTYVEDGIGLPMHVRIDKGPHIEEGMILSVPHWDVEGYPNDGKAEIVPVKKEDKICPPTAPEHPATRIPVKVGRYVRAFKDFNLLGKDVKKGEPVGTCCGTYVDDGKGIPMTVRLKDFPRSCEGDEVQVSFDCVEGCPLPIDPTNPQNIVKGQTAVIDDEGCPFHRFWGTVEQVIGTDGLLRLGTDFSHTDSEKSMHIFPIGSIIHVPLAILHDYIPF